MFVSVAKMYRTIPATSCSAERSFSGLRGIKSYLRSTMGEAGLRSLVVLNTDRVFNPMSVKPYCYFKLSKGEESVLNIIVMINSLYQYLK